MQEKMDQAAARHLAALRELPEAMMRTDGAVYRSIGGDDGCRRQRLDCQDTAAAVIFR
jgi:hypothetical protein